MEDQVFGRRYRAIEKIGTGGMADVFKAVDDVLGRTVAVKVMHPRYAADPAFAARFRQEAQAAANLVSPNIVNMYDWGADGDTYYIVMEYVRGNDLKSIILDKGALSSTKVADIGAQVCSALSVAHGYDIIHRDIKPHNIMVQPDGSVKVMDFGIARAGNSTMTQTGSVLGTAHYVSPEQAQGKELQATSDLYSLGIVLYEAATGELPFDADTPVAVALKQVNEQPRTPRTVNPSVDPGLEAIIVKAMQKNPMARYQSADEMRRDLQAVAQGRPPAGVGAGVAGAGVAAAAGGAPGIDETAVMPSVGGGQGGGYGGSGGERRSLQPRKRPVWPWVLAVILLALAGVGVAWAMGAFGARTVQVPDLTGKDLAGASATLLTTGLVPGQVTHAFSDTVAAGKVIPGSEQPPKGSSIPKGDAVSFQISDGPASIAVPKVVGLSEADAIRALQTAGFNWQATPPQSDKSVPSGQVASQTPAAGTKLPKGATVTYTVSKGIPMSVLPDVTGMSRTSALKKLEGLGFKTVVSYDFSATVSSGDVISQDPSSGGSYEAAKTTVTLTVSQGAGVKVPDVTTMLWADAKSVLANHNLLISPSTDQSGTVATQDPPANTVVKKGSTVKVTFPGP